MREWSTDKIGKHLDRLYTAAPEVETFLLRYSHFPNPAVCGWRLSCVLKPGWHAKAGFARWPDGLGLGAGKTLGECFEHSRRSLETLRDVFLERDEVGS